MGDNTDSEPRLDGAHWEDTEYALVLTLREDGKPGDLYMVWNGSNSNEQSKSRDDERVAKDRKSFGGSNSWTVAKLEDYDLTIFNDDPWTVLAKDFEICTLSKSKPEVVQTGVFGNWSDGVLPVGLFNRD